MSSILQKNKLENVNFCPSLLGQKNFIRLLGQLKKKSFRNQLIFIYIGCAFMAAAKKVQKGCETFCGLERKQK